MSLLIAHPGISISVNQWTLEKWAWVIGELSHLISSLENEQGHCSVEIIHIINYGRYQNAYIYIYSCYALHQSVTKQLGGVGFNIECSRWLICSFAAYCQGLCILPVF